MIDKGYIVSISGPIVRAKGFANPRMYDVVYVGKDGLIGEIIKIIGDTVVIQVYEENSGSKPGEVIESSGRPLSLALAPGILGAIYDGIQRPLMLLDKVSGAFIQRGIKVPPIEEDKKWHFVPTLKEGDKVYPGAIVGSVQETSMVVHKIMVPPTASGGTIAKVAKEGDYTIKETIYAIKDDTGTKEYSMLQYWPARVGRPYIQDIDIREPLLTGQRVIDTFFPIGKGGAAAIPGGFGTGKTMTQHQLAKWSAADIIVYIGCGERGNEMTDVLNEFPKLVDPRSGKSIMERTVLIANTSNMPVAAREVSIYTGVTIAEYFRDMGYDVAIMADSTSRWAEALRELSGRLEEMPAEEGFPAYLPTKLAEFYERAGRVKTLNGNVGSVSIIGAVSPPGGDFSEPVVQHTKRFIRCFWALDRTLANARHYPAISWINSYSEYVESVKDWWGEIESEWYSLREFAMGILKEEDRLMQIVKLVGPDALPDKQRLTLLTARIIKNGFLQQNAFDKIDMYSMPEKQLKILQLMIDFHKKALELLDKGITILQINKLEIIDEIVRLKSTVENDKLEKIDNVREKMEGVFEEILK